MQALVGSMRDECMEWLWAQQARATGAGLDPPDCSPQPTRPPPTLPPSLPTSAHPRRCTTARVATAPRYATTKLPARSESAQGKGRVGASTTHAVWRAVLGICRLGRRAACPASKPRLQYSALPEHNTSS